MRCLNQKHKTNGGYKRNDKAHFILLTSRFVCYNIHMKRQVKSKMRFIIMFVAAVCFMFLIKLKWPKTKNIYDEVSSSLAGPRSTSNTRSLHHIRRERETNRLIEMFPLSLAFCSNFVDLQDQ